MKHLKRKLIFSGKTSSAVREFISNSETDSDQLREIIENKLVGYVPIGFSNSNEVHQLFEYEVDGRNIMIPEPNPVVIYFDSAISIYIGMESRRNDIFSKTTMFENSIFASEGDFYRYFSRASTFAIMLFASLEAFVNRTIPSSYEYKKEYGKIRTEIYTKSQIQRNIGFIEKIKDVLPQCTGRNFVSQWSHKYDYIVNLKKFRDEVTHTKTYKTENDGNHYKELYRTSLNFDYKTTLQYAMEFINFYEDGLIEECDLC